MPQTTDGTTLQIIRKGHTMTNTASTARLLFLALLLSLTGTLTATSSAFAESSSFSSPYPMPPWLSNRSGSDYYKPSYQNGNAGYPGSHLPPSEYQPDARSREFYRERSAPLPPLDNGQYSRQPTPYCSGENCGR